MVSIERCDILLIICSAQSSTGSLTKQVRPTIRPSLLCFCNSADSRRIF